jgi:hypothetical protein
MRLHVTLEINVVSLLQVPAKIECRHDKQVKKMAAKTSGRKQNGHNDSMCAIQIVIMAM